MKDDLRFVRDACSRQQVEAIIKKTIALKNLGKVDEIMNWDCERKHIHNSLFIHIETGLRWVVYLPEHAYPGEVKVISNKGFGYSP